jgi:hypothetical protein
MIVISRSIRWTGESIVYQCAFHLFRSVMVCVVAERNVFDRLPIREERVTLLTVRC